MTFPAEPATVRRLEALIAAERDCCAWMRFEISREPGRAVVSVSVSGPAEARDALVATFA